MKGEVPRKTKGYNGKWVYIYDECKWWRQRIAQELRRTMKKRKVKKLRQLHLYIYSDEEHPDIDTIRHQAQDAASKDAYGLADNHCGGWQDRVPEGPGGPTFVVIAKYEV